MYKEVLQTSLEVSNQTFKNFYVQISQMTNEISSINKIADTISEIAEQFKDTSGTLSKYIFKVIPINGAVVRTDGDIQIEIIV